MAFNINDFKTRGLTYGGARPTLFHVNLSAPGLVRNVPALQKLPFTCSAASLPQAQIGTIPVSYFGRQIKLAGDRVFDNWTITVMNDEDFKVRAMFEAWNNSLNSFVSNVRNSGYRQNENNYKGVLDVTQFSKDGKPVRRYQVVGAIPEIIGPIQLGWSEQNRIEEFQVSIAYDYWLPIGETEGAARYLRQTGAGTTGGSGIGSSGFSVSGNINASIGGVNLGIGF